MRARYRVVHQNCVYCMASDEITVRRTESYFKSMQYEAFVEETYDLGAKRGFGVTPAEAILDLEELCEK